MSYIAVQYFNKATNDCIITKIDEKTFNAETAGVSVKLDALGAIVVQNNLKPVNFSVGRHNEVVMDCGSFDRFNLNGCAVVLAEIKTRSGRNMGYRLLSCANGVIVNMTTKDIVDKAKAQSHPFLQNGIIRNDTVNCYPLHPYPVIETGVKLDKNKPRKAERKPQYTEQTMNQVYTDEQLNEIKLCRQEGIDSKLIENPKLSAKQMRVLWMSKKNGSLAEHYAKPEYPVDVMKFYADRFKSIKIVKECNLMLQHPEFDVAKLGELYLCVCYGVDYADLLNKDVSHIEVERELRRANTWGTLSDRAKDDILMKGLAFARKVKDN